MPKQTKIPGLVDYGGDDNGPPKQTVYPKSQGGVAPSSTPAQETKIPGLKDYGAKPPAVADSQGDGTWSGLWNDVTHPQAANLSRPQTWRDWVTKTYSPTFSDAGRAALDDVSFGTADYARSKLTGENIDDLRARTADSQAAMGPMGPVVNALTYAVPGAGVAKGLEAANMAGKVAARVGRYGAGALEGATTNAASSVGHQAGGYIDPLKVAKDAGAGAAFGVGGQVVGDASAAAVRNISNYVRGSPGRSGEAWDWRARAASGDPTLQSDVAISRATLPADHPAQGPLAKTQDALAQSTDPGMVAHATTGLGSWAAARYGGGGEVTQAILGAAGPFASKYFVNKPAQMINTADRNINVGQSMDQLYPALYGPQTSPTGAPRPALDTSGWANAVRQGAIGGERPVDQDRDAQWW
jgi:hypothetical protein